MIKFCEIDISMTYRCVTNGFALTPMHKVDTHETREMTLIEGINEHLKFWKDKSVSFIFFLFASVNICYYINFIC